MLKLTYITIISVILLLTLVAFRITTTHTIVREIHHYDIRDVAVEAIAREVLYEHMREILNEQMWMILYGHRYEEPIFPDYVCFWWEISPYNLFNIFPDGATDYYYGNQDPP